MYSVLCTLQLFSNLSHCSIAAVVYVTTRVHSTTYIELLHMIMQKSACNWFSTSDQPNT